MLYLVLTKDQLKAVEQINNFGQCHVIRIMRHSQWQELVDAGYCHRDGNTYRAHEVYSTPDFQMCEPDTNGVSNEIGECAFEDSARYRFLLDKGFLQG